MTTSTSAATGDVIPAPGTAAPGRTVNRLPGLDGLRAIAVVAVLCYHAGYSWMTGGYLGVDLFFVLSGFLVTGLLLAEQQRDHGIAFGRFWMRRIRRLVPAQLTLLLALLVFITLFHRPELYEFRGQAVAALTASVNWFLIATQNSYFDAIGRPPVLRHLWSLAIEMQFYLVWPVVFLVVVKRFGRSLLTMFWVFVGGALASAVLLAVLAGSGPDPSNAYFNSFSRLTGLLFGAALALVWRPKLLAGAAVGQRGPQVDRVGAGALVVALLFFVFATDTGIGMYRIGFLVFSAVAVVLVAAACHPTARLAGPRGFGHPVLAAIGARSYGIYLWHWPIFAFTRPGIDLHWNLHVVFVLRLLLTGLCSELCFRYVEVPWHRRERSLADLRRWFSRPADGSWGRPAAVGASSLGVGLCLIALVLAPVHKDATVAAIEDGEAAIEARQHQAAPKVPLTAAPVVTSTTVDPSTPKRIPDFAARGHQPFVTAIGDSVMVGAAPGLYEQFGDDIFIDAKVARQAKGIPAIISSLRAARGLGDVLLIHIGTNGTVTEEEIRDMVAAAKGTPVVFLTVRCDRSWEADVNETLARVVATIPDAYLIDWHAFADAHGDWFRPDTVHLTTTGIDEYADLIHGSLTGQPPG